MNHIYRIIWNAIRHQWTAVAETARSRGGKGRAVVIALGLLAAGPAAAQATDCLDDPLVGASALLGSKCTTSSTGYTSDRPTTIWVYWPGSELDATSVTDLTTLGTMDGQGVLVEFGGKLTFGVVTLNVDGRHLAVNTYGDDTLLNSTGVLTIDASLSGPTPAGLRVGYGAAADLAGLDITVETSSAVGSEPASGIRVDNLGSLNVRGTTRVDMLGSRHAINPGLEIREGGEAQFDASLDIASPDTAVLVNMPGSAILRANGGGTIQGGIAAINLIDGASADIHLRDTSLLAGRNVIMIGCGAYASGCMSPSPYPTGGSPITNAMLTLDGGSAVGSNFLYVHHVQPDGSFVIVQATNGAEVQGNVVTATDNAGTNTPTDIQLSSGATLAGAVIGGGGSAGSEAGNATQRANIALNLANATWILTGSSNLKTLSNGAGGLVDFGTFSGSYKTLTVKNYVGGGDITFNTFLGNSSSPSDKLVIDGGSATGSSRVWVRNTAGLGAQTTGNGILLVESVNGGTTAPSAFTLGQAVIAGAYDYSLLRAGENWYLSSSTTTEPPQPPTVPSPESPPEPTPSVQAPAPTPSVQAPASAPSPVPQQNFRAESSLYAALPAQTLAVMGVVLEMPDTPPPSPVSVEIASAESTTALTALTEREQAQQIPGTWVRLVSSHARNQAHGESANGAQRAQFKADTELLQGGRQIFQETHGETGHSVSLIGALGSVSGDVTHTNAAGAQSLAGSNKVELAALGAALSQQLNAKTYLNASAMVSHLRAHSTSVRSLGFKTSGTGYGATMEAGQRLTLAPGWIWQPHATLRLVQTHLDNTRDDAGQVQIGRARSAQAGFGLTVHTSGERATQFNATVRLVHEFEGRPGTTLTDANGNNGQTFQSHTHGTGVLLKAGVQHRVGESSRLFATLNHNRGLNSGNQKSRDTGMTVGAHFAW